MYSKAGDSPKACSGDRHKKSQERSKKASVTVGECQSRAAYRAVGPVRPEPDVDVIVGGGLDRTHDLGAVEQIQRQKTKYL